MPNDTTLDDWSSAFPTPLHQVADEKTERAGVCLYLKRDDLAFMDVPGNKVRKMKYNLEAALSEKTSTLLTFGGAYSNSLRAVAILGEASKLRTIGIVRGEEHKPLNPSLQVCADHGMELHYVSREQYRLKEESEFLGELTRRFGPFYLLPEGGTNDLAVCGCAELVDEITLDFDYITCSIGTGGTMAGIISGLNGRGLVIGYSSLKGGRFLRDDVQRLLDRAGKPELSNWQVETDFHFGGYAKRKPELDAFGDWFKAIHDIALDWVYEAKMLYGVYAMMAVGRFDRGSTIITVIAGGPEPS